MELLVATWSVRLALVGALLVGGVTLASGMGMIDVAIRVGLTAFLLTFAGRQAIGWLETPEQRVLRMRDERARRQPGKGGER
jgi:hypothetical protein